MRLDGIFIGVEVDDAAAADAAIAAKLTEVCPVDIFAVDGRRAEDRRRAPSTSASCAACARTRCPARSPC